MKTSTRKASLATDFCLFMLFAALYLAPVASHFAATGFPDRRVAELIGEALAVRGVQLDILRNVVAHLVLVAIWYALVRWIALNIAHKRQISPLLSQLLFTIIGWLFLLAANKTAFPTSDYSFAFSGVARTEVCVVTGLLLVIATAYCVMPVIMRWARSPWGVAMAIGVTGLGLATSAPGGWFNVNVSQSKRNVIIIGIDSLSAAMWAEEQRRLPNLSALMQHATQYQRAYTPLARTFPAWVVTLSGRSPAETGAIFNLRNLDHVDRGELVSKELKKQGYRTVFAIDERRFNNMDRDFGFDHVVGPGVGILDFAVQPYNDTPLTNLLLQTRLGAYALSYSRLNVASHANYDADGFVNEISAAAKGADQLFLAAHFLSAHFPFKSRHSQIDIHHENRFHARQLEALTGIDVQVGRLMASLKQQGHLQDALVIVLSDHGEALGKLEGVTTEQGEQVKLESFGHGSNIVSDHQNRIILGTVQFRNGSPVGDPETRHEQVSLLDIRAAIEQYVRDGSVDIRAQKPCIIVETGFRLSAAADYRSIDPKQVAAQGLGFYEVDPQGRMRFRESALEGLVRTKDVGLRCAHRFTYYKDAAERYFSYRLTNDGLTLTEIESVTEDVEVIENYRKALVASANIASTESAGMRRSAH